MKFCDACGIQQFEAPSTVPTLAPLDYFKRRIDRINVMSGRRLRFVPDALLSLVLFLSSAMTIFPFFFSDFTQNFGSIESAYISDSVFIANRFPNIGWYPFWYGGFPFHLSYPPLFITLVALLHLLSGVSVEQSYHILGGVGYSISPVALYFLAKFFMKSRVSSFLAGLAYAFVPTFLPFFASPRVDVLAMYGEAPHLFGLTLALFAILQLLRCVSRPTWLGCVTASLLVAAVALSNLISLYGLAFLMIGTVLTEIIYRNRKTATILWVIILVGLIAYGFSAFQYDLSFIMSSAQYAGFSGSSLPITEIIAVALILAGLVAVDRFVSPHLVRKGRTKPFFFGIVWLALAFLIVAGSQSWFGLPAIAPQGGRFVPELDAGISFCLGLLIMVINDVVGAFPHLAPSFKLGSRVSVFGTLFAVLLLVSVLSLPHSLSVTQATTNLNDVPEYRVATWLSGHVTDEMVFAPGSVAFWLNVFSNVRQLRGGSDQGATNTWWAAARYQIATGSDPEVSVLLAQALNVKYIVITFPNASTVYHDYTYPDKFVNLLPLRYYFGGNGIYEVPLNRPALIEPVSAEGASALKPIQDALDTVGLSSYVNLTQNSLNNPGVQVSYANINPDLYRVLVSNASPDTAILVKMTYDPEWHADLNGMVLQVLPIGLDYMIIYPQTQGNYAFTLHFDRSLGQMIGLFVSVITLGSVIAITVLDFRRNRKSSKSTERVQI